MGKLPTNIDAFQNQCYNGETYVGFVCPAKNPRCRIRAIEQNHKSNLLDAFRAALPLIEKAHKPNSRFSQTRTTYTDQVVIRCPDCHAAEHANDPSACRGKRR